MPKITIYQGNNLPILKAFPDSSFELIYIDPPFNTGKKQRLKELSYDDSFSDFKSFIKKRIKQAYRLLKDNGSLFFHIDYREVHYCKVWIDKIFGRESFKNEIIWAYDYGARQKNKWPTKHDTILWYAKNPDNYIFNYDDIDRIPYLAPGLAGPEKAKIGKTPTDVWWNTIVPVNKHNKERTGYPTQKPLSIINRIVKVHSNKNDTLLDFFAGSGTLGESAYIHNRNCVLIDKNPDAIKVMQKRFKLFKTKWKIDNG